MDLFTLQVDEDKLHPNFKSVTKNDIPSGYVSIGMNLEKDRVCQVYLNNSPQNVDEGRETLFLESGKELIMELTGKHMTSRMPI